MWIMCIILLTNMNNIFDREDNIIINIRVDYRYSFQKKEHAED